MSQDTRPPVGSTGTLAELQVGPGDVVKCVSIDERFPGLGEILTINENGYGVSANINAFTPAADVEYGRTYRLISRATTAQPTQTVTTNGRHYDLTALETPFGMLPKPVQEALKAWPHGWERYIDGEWIGFGASVWWKSTTYRAKPAPVDERVKCYRGAPGAAEHGTCIRRADGTIDWSTWEPEA